MKSAYELAMERLQKEDPDGSVSLTDEQKAALQEIDQKYDAKIAERDVFLQKRLTEARSSGDQEAIEQIEKQRRNEEARLNEDREVEKNKIRNEAREQS